MDILYHSKKLLYSTAKHTFICCFVYIMQLFFIDSNKHYPLWIVVEHKTLYTSGERNAVESKLMQLLIIISLLNPHTILLAYICAVPVEPRTKLGNRVYLVHAIPRFFIMCTLPVRI